MPKRQPLSNESFDDFDPAAVEQLRQNLNIPIVAKTQPTQPLHVVSTQTQAPAPEQKTKRLNVDVPDDLHRWLKGYSAHQGITMSQVVLGLLEQLRSGE